MKLPKLYRVCWVKLYWLTDTCEGGEHVQRDGYYHLRARRALKPDNSWFWQIDKWDAEQCKWELSMVDDLEPEDMFEDYVYRNPHPYKEGDWCHAYQRLTIKEQLAQTALIKELDEIPF